MAAFSASIEGPSGWHRLHGRKPVAFASASVSCSCTFFGLAVRGGHEGRQKKPVVPTEYQNFPSAARSRARTRTQRGSFVTPSSTGRDAFSEVVAFIIVALFCRY